MPRASISADWGTGLSEFTIINQLIVYEFGGQELGGDPHIELHDWLFPVHLRSAYVDNYPSITGELRSAGILNFENDINALCFSGCRRADV